MSCPTGFLWYQKQNNRFLINESQDSDGWAPLPVSLHPEEIPAQELQALADALSKGSANAIYVDQGNPNASDSKDNRGQSPLHPFRTLERALIEAARRSFRRGAVDISDRVSIHLAPGIYDVENGFGGAQYNGDYNRRQDAARLLLANKDYIINGGYAAITSNATHAASLVGIDPNACKRDLSFFVDAVAKDISSAGNYYIRKAAMAIKTASGTSFISAYGTAAKRSATVAAITQMISLSMLAIKNQANVSQGGISIEGITAVPPTETNPCASLQSEAATLYQYITATLSNTGFNPVTDITLLRGSDTANFPETGEPTAENIRAFNSQHKAGIILPRGVSIIGADLRKVVIRPKYVPNSTDSAAGRSAIFRLTGNNFLTNFTFFDQPGLQKSHHKLSCFEFCGQGDLDAFYDKVALAFNDSSSFNRLQDAAVLLKYNIGWIQRKTAGPRVSYTFDTKYRDIFEAQIPTFLGVIALSCVTMGNAAIVDYARYFKKLHVDEITDTAEKTAALTAYGTLLDQFFFYMREALANRANPEEGGYRDERITTDPINPTNPCQDVEAILSTFVEIVRKTINNQTVPITPYQRWGINDVAAVIDEYHIVGNFSSNSVEGASPYIYSVSLRSKFGMCGVDANGGLVGGFRSFVAAQFTVISLQTDTAAFITSDALAAKEVANKRYKGSSLIDVEDYRNFGYRVTNGAYAQLVSCFCIGPALHYAADSGAEFSITNSTSNFGDVSAYAKGFVDNGAGHGAFTQDQYHKFLGIVRPYGFKINDVNEADNFLVGAVASYQYSTTTSAYNRDAIAWNNPSASWKNWAVDPEATPPAYSQFNNITYVKLRLSGPIKDLGNYVRYELDNNGNPDKTRPILEYIYAVPALTPRTEYSNPPELPNITTGVHYNDPLKLERRAEVIDVISEDTIVIKVGGGGITTREVGEWFERDTYYNVIEPSRTRKVISSSSLIGRSLYIKRFVDTRTDSQKRFRMLVGLGKNGSLSSRVPTVNYLLRKQTGVDSNSTQPFAIRNSYSNLPVQLEADRNKLFYINEVSSFEDMFGNEAKYVYDGLSSTIRNEFSIDKLIGIEVLSANSDTEYRSQTSDDLAINNLFYITKDAKDVAAIVALNTLDKYSFQSRWSADNPNAKDVYYSRYNIIRIVDLLFGATPPTFPEGSLWSMVTALATNQRQRIQLASSQPLIEFNKPSTIRIAGQTWEYLGYYNYDTGVPELQKETLGDRIVSLSERSVFRLEKLQKYVAGGRIYATGMDELGNIVEGNTYRDLKTGKAQTVVRGTSVEVLSSSSSYVPEVFEDVSITGSFTASNGASVDLAQADLKMPNTLEGDTLTLKYNDVRIEDNPPSIVDGITINNTNNGLDVSTINLKVGQVTSIDSKVIDLREAEKVYLPYLNTTGGPSGDAAKYKLARKADESEVKAESGSEGYVTPSDLRVWRAHLKVQTSSGTSSIVYVGYWPTLAVPKVNHSTLGTDPDFGKPLSYSTFSTESNIRVARGDDPLQLADPNKANFRTLSNMEQVSVYTEKEKTETDQITLVMSPGIYVLDGYIFYCGIKIYGAYNNGTQGRFDGLDGPETNPALSIRGCKSVIFACIGMTDEGRLVGNTYMSAARTAHSARFLGKSNWIERCIFWGPEMYAKSMREYVWAHVIIGGTKEAPLTGYDYAADKINFYKETGKASIHNRMVRGVANADWSTDYEQNTLGFSHPTLKHNVTTPFWVDDLITILFLRQKGKGYTFRLGVSGGGNANIHWLPGVTYSPAVWHSATLSFNSNQENCALTLRRNIIGAVNPTAPLIGLFYAYGCTLDYQGNMWRGNTKRLVRAKYSTFGLVQQDTGVDYEAGNLTATRAGSPVVLGTITASNVDGITFTGNHITGSNGYILGQEYGEDVHILYGFARCAIFVDRGSKLKIRLGTVSGVNLKPEILARTTFLLDRYMTRLECNSGAQFVHDDSESGDIVTYSYTSVDSGNIPVKTPITAQQILDNVTVGKVQCGVWLSDNKLLGQPGLAGDVSDVMTTRGPILETGFFEFQLRNVDITFVNHSSSKNSGTNGYSGPVTDGMYILRRSITPTESKPWVILPHEAPPTSIYNETTNPTGEYVHLNNMHSLDALYKGAIGTQVASGAPVGSTSMLMDTLAYQIPKPKYFCYMTNFFNSSFEAGGQYSYAFTRNGAVPSPDLTTNTLLMNAEEVAYLDALGLNLGHYVFYLVNSVKGNAFSLYYSGGSWSGVTITGERRFDYIRGVRHPYQMYLNDENGVLIPTPLLKTSRQVGDDTLEYDLYMNDLSYFENINITSDFVL